MSDLVQGIGWRVCDPVEGISEPHGMKTFAEHLDDVVLRCPSVTLCLATHTRYSTTDGAHTSPYGVDESSTRPSEAPGCVQEVGLESCAPLESRGLPASSPGSLGHTHKFQSVLQSSQCAITVHQLLAEIAVLAKMAGAPVCQQVLDGLTRISRPGSSTLVYEVQLIG